MHEFTARSRPAAELPTELLALTEQLAERIHDLWATGRRRDEWSYGAHRDDLNKKHPCLVPYNELPEEEKQYDRETALGALRTILHLGYRILPPPVAPAPAGIAPVEPLKNRSEYRYRSPCLNRNSIARSPITDARPRRNTSGSLQHNSCSQCGVKP